MFNEAFWFFYAVDLAHAVATTFKFVAFFALVGAFVAFGLWKIEHFPQCKVPCRGLLIAFILAQLIALAIPSKTALYAGAGQYIAEETEITETLLNMKQVIDQRIEDMIEEE